MSDWRQQAACRGKDPAVWFSEDSSTIAQARAICMACPVAQECLQQAVQDRELAGVWGATLQWQREEMWLGRRPVKVPQPRDVAGHGTRASYERGCHCGPCRKAANSYRYRYRRRSA